MRFLIKVRLPIDSGNEAISDPEFGHKMNDLLAELKVEAAYFTLSQGQRGFYLILNMDDAAQMPAIAEPFFFWLKADVEVVPVMLPEDLQRGGPAIGAAIQKWLHK